jgi:pyruvate dehydrogenase E2 component (dihydrolipoamide acetyltransferase)
MAVNVVMEALSPTMEEGRLVSWKKKEGDAVRTGDVLAEVETDKAVMELVARADGTLLRILQQEGSTVAVSTPVAVIGAAGESAPEAPAAAAAAPTEQPKPAAAAPAPAETAARARVTGYTEAPSQPPPAPSASASSSGRTLSSPLARRLATEKGVDISQINGSGPGGRVIARDVEGARAGAPASAPVPPSPRSPSSGYEDVPLTQIRKTIAKRLSASIGPVPHFFLTSEVDMERAAEARDELKKAAPDAAFSFNDLVIKAVAQALRQHPACNAWWMDDHIRIHHDVHIGMAVAIPDGLITPVIRFADRKGLGEIGAEARALAEKARNRKLTPEEYTGATFSISNLGMLDIDEFTAVINPPEAGILAVGRIVAKPVVVDGRIEARRQMRVTMSCDHRVIDGATGAKFLQSVKRNLENPLAMLI